jgi:hypothetical protein
VGGLRVRLAQRREPEAGICGSTACASIAAVKKAQQQGTAAQSAPAQLGAQAQQVRDGHVVDCSPAACMAVGSTCARAAGALEILKDQASLRTRPLAARSPRMRRRSSNRSTSTTRRPPSRRAPAAPCSE